ncbi:MAG TPA: hypothetical protein VEP90_29950 [Methylomirabilota bacterium]|nr:hypothetical protein [Methylomirabilota bacterium]
MCAVFNPQVPDQQEPNYSFWARPIKQPQPSKVGEEITKGLAEVAQVGLKGADYVHKTDIRNELHQKLDEETDRTSANLKEAEDTLMGKDPTTGQADTQDLNTRMAKLTSLKEFGKLTMEDYQTRLDALQSSVRSRHPSPEDRDFIDDTASRYYREDPTNRTIRARLAVLSSLSSGANAEERRLKEEAMKTPDGWPVYQQYEKNPTAENKRNVENYIAKYKQMEAQANVAKWSIEEKKARREDVSQDTYATMSDYFAGRMAHHFDGLTLGAGLKWDDFLGKVSRGELTPSQDEWGNAKNAILARTNSFRMEAASYAQKQGWARDLGQGGQEKIAKAVDDIAKPYEQFATDIMKSGGFALGSLELNKAKNDSYIEALRGEFPLDEQILKYKGTPLGIKLEDQALKQGYYEPAAIARRMAIHADIFGKPDSSFRRSVDIAADPKSKLTPRQKQEVVNTSLDSINQLPQQVKEGIKIGNLDAAVKLNEYAFDPKNLGIVNKFDIEGPNVKQGRYTVFDKLTNPQVMDASWKLSQHGHPEAWQRHATFAENEARILVKQEIDDIQKFQTEHAEGGPGGAGYTMRGTPRTSVGVEPFKNTYVTWDDKNSRWDFHSDIPSARGAQRHLTTSPETTTTIPTWHSLNPNSWARDRLEATVNRANSVMENLKTIPQNEGQDVNAYLMQFMIDRVGLDPTARGIRFSDGFLQSMVNTKLKTQGKPLGQP